MIYYWGLQKCLYSHVKKCFSIYIIQIKLGFSAQNIAKYILQYLTVASSPAKWLMTLAPPGWRLAKEVMSYTRPLISSHWSPGLLCNLTSSVVITALCSSSGLPPILFRYIISKFRKCLKTLVYCVHVSNRRALFKTWKHCSQGRASRVAPSLAERSRLSLSGFQLSEESKQIIS